ncbi:MAG: ATP-dependent DNA helicase RecG [Acidobacteriota bacterium]
MSVKLETPVQYIKGVGPKRAEMFSRVGIHTAEDLLKYKPFRYEDRTNFRRIKELKPEEEAVIQGKVAVTGGYTTPMKKMKIFEVLVTDDSGSLQVKFFNQPYLDKVFRKGQTVILYGVPRVDNFSLGISMVSPEFEIIERGSNGKVHTGRIVPIYRRVGQLSTRMLRQIIFQLLDDLPERVEDPLPPSVLRKYKFPDRRLAFQEVHFPSPRTRLSKNIYLKKLESSQTAAHQRFIFEEFFLFQLGLHVTKKQRQIVPKKRVIRIKEKIREVIKSILPFHPTSAQKRVLKEIVDDLCGPKVMNRLLQGDVGSGKTIVALQAMIVVIENGCQAVLMAPTEILAEQHYNNIRQYLSETRYQLAFLTSRVKGKERESVLTQIDSGEIDILVGTHALIQEGVDFKSLGLVVIDEQHRFGVLQRSQLMEKGDRPETLVMTATPIPRSLALTLYGDLDLSVLDEMPPGRQPVRTLVKTEKSRQEVYRAVGRELEKGRQAFVVYPLIEESEKVDLRAATEMAEHLQKDVFPDYSVGLLHGRLKADEKETLMWRFKAGEIDVLVSTTVIEVGIDVPNATLTVIEHAERFGLSQLHQLRGRIGRGKHPGLCILMTEGTRSREAYQRLNIMRKTNDGFKIAEKDLEIRGPGEFVGTRQSGIPEFLFGNIVRDRKQLELARQEAEKYLSQCLESASQPPQQVLSEFAQWWKERYGLYNVG